MKIYLFCYAETEDKYCDFERLTSEGRHMTEKFGAAHVKDVCFDRLFLMPQHGLYLGETLTCLGVHLPNDAITIEPPDVSSGECVRRILQRFPTSALLVLGSVDQQAGLTRSLLGKSVFLRKCEGAIVDYDSEKFTLVKELRRS